MNLDNQKPEYRQLIQRLIEDKKKSLEAATELFHSDLRESLAELSVVDNHPADIGTEVYQRARELARRDALISKCGAIDSALERWEKGAFGMCEHCGGEIPLDRLELLPYTTVCTACSRLEEQEEQHSMYREPVENGILNFSSDGLKDGAKIRAFDREVSFQEVARFGTSDSPQDLGTNRDIEDYEALYEDYESIYGDSEQATGAHPEIDAIETEQELGRENTIHFSKKHGR